MAKLNKTAGSGLEGSARRDEPWIFRTYSGHSSAAASNALYRTNLARGQTGLSVAFDLPTQTGYDADHPLAKGEVGKVGVPVGHLGDMMRLFEGLPLATMNTSMTINATAPWLFALYIAAAERQGTARRELAGTVQNDIVKEYLSRGTYIFPPKPSLKLSGDVIAFAYREVPKWNPTNVCSYHLQEAGATPEQELAFALATAVAVLDGVKASGQVPAAEFPQVVGRISFFVNAGIRFVTEMCKMRAFAELWDELCRERWGIEDEKLRRFRYGVQVNSLGLTEQQPENNVYRILLETLAVTLSKKARARAVQLPAWNEALGLPRPWDQQWSLRLQQILAYETDLLEFEDIFDGAGAIAAKVEALKTAAREELARIEAMGGAIAAVEQSYMKRKLVESNSRRLAAIESGAQKVVGVNCFTETACSPLLAGADGGFLAVDPAAEQAQVEALAAWRCQAQPAGSEAGAGRTEGRREGGTQRHGAFHRLRTCGRHHRRMGRRLARDLWRIPRTDGRRPGGSGRRRRGPRRGQGQGRRRLGAPGPAPENAGGQAGLDGHSNGAEQIAVRARDAGFEVVYEGIRLTPAQIANAALEEGVHVIGLSILSGSHEPLVQEILARLKATGLGEVPVVVGGIIPPEDAGRLIATGVARVYTPKDYDLNAIMADIVDLVDRATREAA